MVLRGTLSDAVYSTACRCWSGVNVLTLQEQINVRVTCERQQQWRHWHSGV